MFESGFVVSFLILLPVLGLTEIYFMRFSYVAEHWLTLGMLGFLVPAVEHLYSKKYYSYAIWVFVFFLGALNAYYQQEYSSEKKLLETSLQRNAESILPHNILGLLYKNENNFEKAFYHFEQSIQIHPNAESYYNKASLFEKLGKTEMAIDNYEKAIALNPYFANTYNNMAIIYVGLKNLKVALEYFDQALKLDASDVRIYFNIGRAYEENKEFVQAAEWYKKALEIQPSNSLFAEALQRVNK